MGRPRIVEPPIHELTPKSAGELKMLQMHWNVGKTNTQTLLHAYRTYMLALHANRMYLRYGVRVKGAISVDKARHVYEKAKRTRWVN